MVVLKMHFDQLTMMIGQTQNIKNYLAKYGDAS